MEAGRFPQQIGYCLVSTKRGVKKRWPCFGRAGNWVLSSPVGPRCTPRKASFLAVTHQPTGLLAGYLSACSPRLMRSLAKYADFFGSARTVRGVMRKWNALSPRQKRWVQQNFFIGI